ncbi:MAG: HAMP domain-containing sensor histidine kinase [Steroidobacteraceae bacterium]
MQTGELRKIATLLEANSDALMATWRAQVRELPAARGLDTPTLNDHLPMLFEQLIESLRSDDGRSIPDVLKTESPIAHGLQRVQDAFDIEEVVAEYNILRGCIHDLVDANGLNLQGEPFRIMNRVFDQAIGLALQAYASRRALDVLLRREEYLAFVAHDLRTPLNAISMAGRVLQETYGAHVGADSGRMFIALRRNVQHLEKLVEKVLEENTNLQTEVGIKLERRHLDLWPMVENLIHDLHPVAGTASTELSNAVPEDLEIYADANLLRRILQNLIANAIRYTPRGHVVVGARRRAGDQGIECWVKDDGKGIPPDMIDAVFDKGGADGSHEGISGLGLAIVKTFVEAHEGEVTVLSLEGQGSTFSFWLPAR